MLQAIELPARIPDLDTGLAYVNTDDLSHLCRLRVASTPNATTSRMSPPAPPETWPKTSTERVYLRNRSQAKCTDTHSSKPQTEGRRERVKAALRNPSSASFSRPCLVCLLLPLRCAPLAPPARAPGRPCSAPVRCLSRRGHRGRTGAVPSAAVLSRLWTWSPAASCVTKSVPLIYPRGDSLPRHDLPPYMRSAHLRSR